ncbi:MAG: dihydrolipoyl dehydrogenase [Deltaproteobacteria bacterium]|nr:dihydrolipoyl dehydrogenase [Deltaproteobacteria bacterium]
MRERYDIAFLGGGPAGYQGAIRAAQLGARVAVVEEREVGGVCLNRGCIPTKTVRASAEVGRTLRRAREFGFAPVEAVPDLAAILARKDRVVRALRSSIERLFQARRVDLVEGRGRLKGRTRIEVQGPGGPDLVDAERIVVATGSRSAEFPVFPPSPRVFRADDLLFSPVLPRHLLVVGGGTIGVEMASLYRELGSEVTVVEALGRILSSEDEEMAAQLLQILRRRKIRVFCGITVTSAAESPEGLRVSLSDGSELQVDAVLLAVGRGLNTDSIGLEELGVLLDRGRLVVDEHQRTNLAGLYGAGDVTGGWLLAHVAFAEGIGAAENALGLERPVERRVIPRCVFSLPEYAAVGLSEEEAAREHRVKVARSPVKGIGMAQALGELEGLVKLVADADTDRLLGAQVLAPHAGDLIAEVAVAMRAGLPSRALLETLHVHPTLSEGILEVAQALHGQAIHLPPPARAP